MLVLKYWSKACAVFLLMFCMSGLASGSVVTELFDRLKTMDFYDLTYSRAYLPVTLSLQGENLTLTINTRTNARTDAESTDQTRDNCIVSSIGPRHILNLRGVVNLISDNLTSIQLQLIPGASRPDSTSSQLSLVLRIEYQGQLTSIPLEVTHETSHVAWLWGEDFFNHMYDRPLVRSGSGPYGTISYLDPLGPEVLSIITSLLSGFLENHQAHSTVAQTTTGPEVEDVPTPAVFDLSTVTTVRPHIHDDLIYQGHFGADITIGETRYAMTPPSQVSFSHSPSNGEHDLESTAFASGSDHCCFSGCRVYGRSSAQ